MKSYNRKKFINHDRERKIIFTYNFYVYLLWGVCVYNIERDTHTIAILFKSDPLSFAASYQNLYIRTPCSILFSLQKGTFNLPEL